ncbi:MAG: hypothetical protein P4M11_09250 [Candidatus Pacebacteria bacterium]|nr:hypothetical protein [Candidatus Paceibacterota bacterium]
MVGIAKGLLVNLETGLASPEEIKEKAERYGTNVHNLIQPRSIVGIAHH